MDLNLEKVHMSTLLLDHAADQMGFASQVSLSTLILYEKIIEFRPCWQEVYYAACCLLVISKNS